MRFSLARRLFRSSTLASHRLPWLTLCAKITQLGQIWNILHKIGLDQIKKFS